MESAQFITGGGRMARDSQRSGRSPLQMCSSAGQGAEASLQLPSTQRPPRAPPFPGSAVVPSIPTVLEHLACPTRYQRALTISKHLRIPGLSCPAVH